MQLIVHTKPRMVISEEGYQIRDKNDVYIEEHIDENGNLVEEHFPHYATVIFVPESFTEEQMNELYVEEEI